MNVLHRFINHINDALHAMYEDDPPIEVRPKLRCGLCNGWGFLSFHPARNATVHVVCPLCDDEDRS